MDDSQKYIDKATQEILNPTFEDTKQYLEVNEIKYENGVPYIERVDLEYSKDYVEVYFAIKDERYFLQINVSKSPSLKICAVLVESGNRVYLTATSEVLSFEELSQGFPFKPLKGWSKGDIRKTGKFIHSFSRISYEPFESEAYELERLLNLLLTELEKNAEAVIQLTKKGYAAIKVCKHQYISSNAGIGFDIETINRLSKLNLGLDISTYIVGKPTL